MYICIYIHIYHAPLTYVGFEHSVPLVTCISLLYGYIYHILHIYYIISICNEKSFFNAEQINKYQQKVLLNRMKFALFLEGFFN